VSEADWAYLAGLQITQFQSGGHRLYLVPAYQAVARTGYDVAALAVNAQAAADAAAGSLATQMALGLAANGVGNQPMQLPRVSMFNGGAFREWEMALSLFPNLQNANYQMTEHDRGKLLFATSGTRTWTLPAASIDMIGWFCRIRNRTGANLTLNPGSAGDAINGGTAGAAITVATGSAMLTVVCTSATAFEVA
jgi:hypothetical protein